MRAEAATPNWGQPREQRVALAAFAAVTVLIVIFLLRDASAFVNSPQDELIGHMGASGGFTLAATGTYLVLRHKRPPLLAILLAGAIITVAAELAQGLVPQRGIELSDIVAGFGGVLITAVGIEIAFLLFSLLVAQRLHTIASAIASIILLVMLVFNLAPDTLSGASPDGEACPFTTIDGSGQRVVIGADPAIEDGCLLTNAGGLGLFGPDGSDTLSGESVLLSSPLDLLANRVSQSGRLITSTEFTTGDFSEDIRPAGSLLVFRSGESNELLEVRLRDQILQVFGPNLISPYRSTSLTEVLEPATRYQLRIELTTSELRVHINDELVSANTVDPGWVEAITTDGSAEDLTLYLGNAPWRGLPLNGVIEWIEIDT